MPRSQRETDIGRTTRAQIMKFITAHMKKTAGQFPTYKEIATGCYLTPSAVRYHLPRLVMHGQLQETGGGVRAYTIPGSLWLTPEEAQDFLRYLENSRPTPAARGKTIQT